MSRPMAFMALVALLLAAPSAGAQTDITQVEPSSGAAGTTLTITITGGLECTFDPVASNVVFLPAEGISVGDMELLDTYVLQAEITIPADTPPGLQTLYITAFGITCIGQDIFEVVCADCGQASLQSISPAAGNAGTSLDVTIQGLNTHFDASSVLSFSGTGISVTNFSAQSATTATATLTLAAGAPTGAQDATITTGAEVASGTDLFEVLCADCTQPRLVSVSPGSAQAGQTVELTITGQDTGFDGTSSLGISGAGVSVDSLSATSATELLATVTLSADAPEGLRDVTVTTGAQVVTGRDMFEVVCGDCSTARLVSITPSEASPGMAVDVTVEGEGTNFDGSSVLTFDGGGITVDTLTPIDATSLTASLSIAVDATLGSRTARVTTGDEEAVGADLFEVVGQPVNLVPDTGEQGQALGTIVLTGGQGGYTQVTSVDLGPGIVIPGFLAPDDATLELVNVNILPDAPVGRRDLVLSLPGGERTLSGVFAVLQGPDTLLLSIDPDHGDRGHPGLAVELVGQNTHFDAEQVLIGVSGDGVMGAAEQAADATHLTARLVIGASATEGARDVSVQVGGGCDLAVPAPCELTSLPGGFSVTPPGSLDAADPALIEAGQDVSVAFSATDGQFADATSLSFDPPEGIEVLDVTVTDADNLVADLRIAPDASGQVRDVTAVTGTEVALGPGLLDVHNPQILTVTPVVGYRGVPVVPITITGIDIPFDDATEVSFSGTGVTPSGYTFDPELPDQIAFVVAIAEDAPIGPRDVTVMAGGLEVTAAGAFWVRERPSSDEGGCGCQSHGPGGLGMILLVLFGLRLRPGRRGW